MSKSSKMKQCIASIESQLKQIDEISVSKTQNKHVRLIITSNNRTEKIVCSVSPRSTDAQKRAYKDTEKALKKIGVKKHQIDHRIFMMSTLSQM